MYCSDREHDACGVGFLVNMNGDKSASIIRQGIEVLENLGHRGATGSDPNTGDGAGLMFQIPDTLFRKSMGRACIDLPAPEHYGVGMMFMPLDAHAAAECSAIVEKTIADEDLIFLGWRDVPVDADVLGQTALKEMPSIKQCFVTSDTRVGDGLLRKLYVARRQIEKQISKDTRLSESFYIASFSTRTIVYKGLMVPAQVPRFYRDFQDPDLKSAVVIVHQRFSTNTFPSWSLAQPFRYLAHNGEINTLRGNKNWMSAREQNLRSELFGTDLKKLSPIIQDGGSDSADLDNALELLTAAGRPLYHAMMMLVPQAWGAKYPMGPDLRGFFEYHAGLMEPWDGPAALAFMDGRYVGAMLDRNGLRPSRYTITRDGFMVLASEAGVLSIPAETVMEKGALRPGEMILVDLKQKRVIKDYEIKMRLARKAPYRRWVLENKISVRGFFNPVTPVAPAADTLLLRQRLFGYSREDLDIILDAMASFGHEPSGSMGSDQPLAVLSENPQLLYWYFKQLFAQVTNPAIDPIREELVMSLMTFLGMQDNILSETPQHSRLIKLLHPILSNEDLDRIRTLNLKEFSCQTLKMGFKLPANGASLAAALDDLCDQADQALRKGFRLIVLSDRDLKPDQVPIPALLAVSALNQHLIHKGVRTSAGIIVETGEAREVMHMACLLGFGASAINPYLAFEIVADMALNKTLEQPVGAATAIENYVNALCQGLLKIMSKMGISTLRSYRNAQVFEAVGLKSELVEKYFQGTASRVEGIGLDEIAKEAKARFESAYRPEPGAPAILQSGGQYRYRSDGERHMWHPDTISLLQRATRTGDRALYREYAALINDWEKQLSTLRGLIRFKSKAPIGIEAVEPVEEIVKRFVTGAMSFGALSKEVHETLAIAMNRLGGMSNSGEGGEDSARYMPLENGDNRASAVKQVASGRFGVTAEYLVNAKEIQIKIAQGAKPGEGGQLPGGKVDVEIARVRKSTPGVTLISPPPHHDIYSIEDIAQLIYDLKNINPGARISVKLASQIGVGTVAAGVAKARAEMILISGYDGGTGASPISSIKHTGTPWELGLTETHQTLVKNGLRDRVRLQVDGQMRTGRDVAIAALLGAEEFGFATAALVVCGCVMMRKCHENNCPVGIATQNPQLRAFYTGDPDHVVTYFEMIAEELREIMATLGIRRVADMVGRSDLLEMNDAIQFWKAKGLDLSRLLHQASAEATPKQADQIDPLDQALDRQMLPQITAAIASATPVRLDFPIRNVHRTVGAMISHQIVQHHGGDGMPDDTLTLCFSGAAGQSFGAFGVKGMTLILSGEANDYLGKGLSGARIIVKPDPGATYDPSLNTIAGNVLLYGATGGEVYINGRAGERFAIRNSGAIAVVEGIGDHGCEYMTRGRVVVLGTTGVNFGAGMSGGIAYVYDEAGTFDNQCNLDMIDLEIVSSEDDQKELKGLIEHHWEYAKSAKARFILENWETCLPRFVKVFPMEYKRVLGQMSKEDEAIERKALNAL